MISTNWLVNPRRKRKTHKIKIHKRTARKRVIHRRKSIAKRLTKNVFKRRSPVAKRRRSHRRNPLMLLGNPMHHRLSLVGRKVSKRSRLARHHRGFVLNPVKALGLPAMKPVVSQLIGVGAGFVAVKMVEKYAPIPAAWKTSMIGSMGVKIGSVAAVYVASGFVVKNHETRKAILVGGILSVAIDLLNQYVPSVMAGAGLGYQISSAPRPMNGLGYQLPSAPKSMSGIGIGGLNAIEQQRYA